MAYADSMAYQLRQRKMADMRRLQGIALSPDVDEATRQNALRMWQMLQAGERGGFNFMGTVGETAEQQRDAEMKMKQKHYEQLLGYHQGLGELETEQDLIRAREEQKLNRGLNTKPYDDEINRLKLQAQNYDVGSMQYKAIQNKIADLMINRESAMGLSGTPSTVQSKQSYEKSVDEQKRERERQIAKERELEEFERQKRIQEEALQRQKSQEEFDKEMKRRRADLDEILTRQKAAESVAGIGYTQAQTAKIKSGISANPPYSEIEGTLKAAYDSSVLLNPKKPDKGTFDMAVQAGAAKLIEKYPNMNTEIISKYAELYFSEKEKTEKFLREEAARKKRKAEEQAVWRKQAESRMVY